MSINMKQRCPGGQGALSTCTYGEVSLIFLGLDVSKRDVFWSKLAEIITMIFLGIKHSQTDISGFCKGNPGLNFVFFLDFMFVYRCQSIKLADIFALW